ncbi:MULTISPECIES: GDSL-type esterase/lipase family protein [unclassified Microbacterium]|uniref:GDSL-type esterase/lipase family protein n=1 Tax=unclassified Microbacterium TaxID=2609290 RepID=UPI000CFD204F|nr:MULTISPECIES: glycosyltransferase [unclassified Microbacterium]PQZ61286.1 glycosyl transferase [Microbacterium sp. MYb43]PQZ82497.1 glycosyl transferase [Microbacterium sp. MYb40]PRB23802.1 glycosyl transferase [Microbacterium sp. MYb54]PRB29697.1 glycosyl transferase [Microbacterium sp. MYb50]PRB70944.1 glycosyl transferase [Microbacterium sp. MYb24]
MRVAIVTESFLPHMNGVTGSVLQILRHLERRGHEAHVIAPAATGAPAEISGARIEAIPSLALPGYRHVRVGTSSAHRIAASLGRFQPDVVHLASPFALGWRGVLAAERLDLPSVAAYQTDVAAYTERYRIAATTGIAQTHIARLHRRATMTLAPSADAAQQLALLGVDRVRRWGRGVDAERFQPSRHDPLLRSEWGTDVVIGYVGRLAPEKQVEDLAALRNVPGTRLVIVGDGPSRARLESLLPDALFLGHLDGTALAAAMASFDLFVHPGESETFGQTLQEAHASGVPVIATGRGGPLDLVRMGIDGWLYKPGDLEDLRMRVTDLAGDARKRRAFGEAGREAVQGRSWESVCDQLLDHFEEARILHRADSGARARRVVRPEPSAPVAARRWHRYVAMGDSLTEGLCDPAPDGALRGWADRLALLLAARGGLHYANLAIRSKRVRDVSGVQLERAIELRPDLVSILIGANDLVKRRVDVAVLAAELEGTVRTLRGIGADVLLVTPFLPGRRAAFIYTRRFAAFATALTGIAARTGAFLIDTDLHPSLAERPNWGEDLVHLSSRGHRFLAYRAGEMLGVPDADALGALDAAMHEHESIGAGVWWRRHALPWVWRRLNGRAAGDGRTAKHDDYVYLGRSAAARGALAR